MCPLNLVLATISGSAVALSEAGSVALPLLFGAIVGFSLGLTGGGGSIFAVPLLVYGLGVMPRDAMGISLAAVGATSLAGAIHRLRVGEVEVGTGLVFAATGMTGAPLGTWVRSLVPGPMLLVLFAGLMLVVAARMWRSAVRRSQKPSATSDPPSFPIPERWTARRWTLLGFAGLATGILSGLFGVGGGFVIVPALVFVGGVAIHRAVGTSLLVITLIGISGVASQVLSGEPLPLELTGLFVAGGVGGLIVGTALGRRISGPTLQKVFAAAMVAVAAYIVVRNLAFA